MNVTLACFKRKSNIQGIRKNYPNIVCNSCSSEHRFIPKASFHETINKFSSIPLERH
jgi:hypothetical protein